MSPWMPSTEMPSIFQDVWGLQPELHTLGRSHWAWHGCFFSPYLQLWLLLLLHHAAPLGVGGTFFSPAQLEATGLKEAPPTLSNTVCYRKTALPDLEASAQCVELWLQALDVSTPPP